MEYIWTSTELTTLTNATYINTLVGSYYTVSATSGSFTGLVNGYQAIPTEVSENTPVDELNNKIVTDWIKEQLGPDQVLIIENNVENQIRIQQGEEPIIIEPTTGRPVIDTGIDNSTSNQPSPWVD